MNVGSSSNGCYERRFKRKSTKSTETELTTLEADHQERRQTLTSGQPAKKETGSFVESKSFRRTQKTRSRTIRLQKRRNRPHFALNFGKSVRRVFNSGQPVRIPLLANFRKLLGGQKMSGQIFPRDHFPIFEMGKETFAILRANHTRRDS